MGFSRQEYWSGLPCTPPGDLPDPGIEPESLTFPALADRFFTTSATLEARPFIIQLQNIWLKNWRSESHSVMFDSLWPHGYTVHGILQALLEWVVFPFSRGSSQAKDQTQVSHIAHWFFTSWATREDQDTGVGSLFLLQQIFLTQELKQGLLCCRWILSQLSYQRITKYPVSSFRKNLYVFLLFLFCLYLFPGIIKYLRSLGILWASFEVLFWILCQAIPGSPILWAGYRRFTVFFWWDFVSLIILDVLLSCRCLHM